MIHELTKDKFVKCEQLVSENMPESLAVIRGTNPGRVFVDDKENPTTGLIWYKSLDIGFNLIGDCFNTIFKEEIGPFMEGYIKSEASKIGMDWFDGSGGTSDWDHTVKEIFKHRDIGNQEQQVYILDEVIQKQNDLPIGYQLCEISEKLLNNVENPSFLHEKILSFWDSVHDFLQKGVGYSIVHENKIVSYCFSGFITTKFSVTDVETAEEYRGKSLAQIATMAYAQECLRRGLTPYWDCMSENLPSNALARKVGFTNIRTYYVQYFQL
jgi:GNAT superfamily N-acetyltransferase